VSTCNERSRISATRPAAFGADAMLPDAVRQQPGLGLDPPRRRQAAAHRATFVGQELMVGGRVEPAIRFVAARPAPPLGLSAFGDDVSRGRWPCVASPALVLIGGSVCN
jgi:hypothetical protein